MNGHDPRVDAYVAAAKPFARPILQAIRAAVRSACPTATEAIKWGVPHFLYKGKILCSMAAFKAHASFGFWHGDLVDGVSGKEASGMGQFGRMTTIADLPDNDALCAMIKHAAQLVDQGVAAARTTKARKPTQTVIPSDFKRALEANPRALATLASFPPGQRREYIEWITDAKRAETRNRRITQAVEWLALGRQRNWKYQNC